MSALTNRADNHKRQTRALSLLFWGEILVFFRIGRGLWPLLPSTIGYLLVLVSLRKLCCKNTLMCLALWGNVLLLAASFGRLWVLSQAWALPLWLVSVCIALLTLICRLCICRGALQLAMEAQCVIQAATFKRLCGAYALLALLACGLMALHFSLPLVIGAILLNVAGQLLYQWYLGRVRRALYRHGFRVAG